METPKSTHKEPLIRLTKRPAMPIWKAWLIRIGAIAVALLICAAFVKFVMHTDPLKVFATLFQGNFGKKKDFWNARQFWSMMNSLAMLLIVALAVTPAFKMKFWNIGAEGQVLVGAVGACAVMIYGVNLPAYILFPVMFIVSILCSMVWAVIPAVFKAMFNTNETLFTLMMNYVAMQLVAYIAIFWAVPGQNYIPMINMDTQIGWFPEGSATATSLFGKPYIVNIIIVFLVTVLMFVYLKYSKHGYEISVVGESENTARYIGINVKKVIIRTMLLSGAVCGIAAVLLVAGGGKTVASNTVGGRGFTAILVSWLAKFNPLGMVFTSFLITFFSSGASDLYKVYKFDSSIVDIMTGIILFLVIASEFFINYKIKIKSTKRAEKEAAK